MKTFINIVIILILLNNKSFSQFYADSVTPDYVIEFMKIADETVTYQDDYRNVKKVFSSEELEHIARLYFKCYNDDPVGFQKYVNEKHKEFEKAPLDVITEKLKIRPWMKVYTLKNKIAEKYGIPFTEIISCPVFIRARYDSVFHSFINISEWNGKLSVNNYVFHIEEVLKGDKFFKSGSNCIVTYSPNAEAPVPEIEKWKSYLIPITTWVDTEDYNGEIYFGHLREYYDRWVMGKPPTTFPIENEIIKNCEYFGIKDTSWTDFKKYFKDTYLIFD